MAEENEAGGDLVDQKVTLPEDVRVVVSNEGGEASLLAIAERVSKIVAAVAIPVVLAVGGWMINSQLKRGELARDYVQEGLKVLRDKESDPELREWARKLVDYHLPDDSLKFDSVEHLAEKLDSAEVSLPSPGEGFESSGLSVDLEGIESGNIVFETDVECRELSVSLHTDLSNVVSAQGNRLQVPVSWLRGHGRAFVGLLIQAEAREAPASFEVRKVRVVIGQRVLARVPVVSDGGRLYQGATVLECP